LLPQKIAGAKDKILQLLTAGGKNPQLANPDHARMSAAM
jgi:hypothetical protein